MGSRPTYCVRYPTTPKTVRLWLRHTEVPSFPTGTTTTSRYFLYLFVNLWNGSPGPFSVHLSTTTRITKRECYDGGIGPVVDISRDVSLSYPGESFFELHGPVCFRRVGVGPLKYPTRTEYIGSQEVVSCHHGGWYKIVSPHSRNKCLVKGTLPRTRSPTSYLVWGGPGVPRITDVSLSLVIT